MAIGSQIMILLVLKTTKLNTDLWRQTPKTNHSHKKYLSTVESCKHFKKDRLEKTRFQLQKFKKY